MSLKLYIPGLKRRVYRALPVLAGLLTMLFCCLLGGIVYSGGRFWAGCEAVYDDTLRLHIRAASDSEADQARKLLVRDALVEETAALTETAGSKPAAEKILRDSLPALRQLAVETLEASGSHDPVSVSLAPAWFNTRRYDTSAGTLTLPAGRYDALVVTIGEGEGHNWWCVLYPSLCLPAASEEAVALYSEAEQAVVEEGYNLKFWVVEAFMRVAAWLSGEEMAAR